MAERQPGMMPYHTGAGIAHHFTDFLPHHGLVTVDGAVAAGGLVFLERAFGKPQARIVGKLPAFGAETLSGAMQIATVKGDHGSHGLMFSLHAWVLSGHGFLCAGLVRQSPVRILKDQLASGRGLNAKIMGNCTPAPAFPVMERHQHLGLLVSGMGKDEHQGHFLFIEAL